MATEYFAFIQPLRDDPGDETLRLAYTDWLDERGDPRAGYLHTEAAWAALQPGDERYRPLYRELSRLAAMQDPTWFTWVGRLAHLARRAWGPVSDGFEPSGSVDLPRAWGKAIGRLPDLFQCASIEKPQFRWRFCPPVDFAAFLCAVGGQTDGFEFYTASSALAAANQTRTNVFGPRRVTSLGLAERSEFWVEFGGWSEQPRYFVCCDFDSPRFGVVAEGEGPDSWMRGTDGLKYRGRNLLDFLTRFLSTSYNVGFEASWSNVPFEEWGTH